MVRNLNTERYTLEEFFNEGLKPGPVCYLVLVQHFCFNCYTPENQRNLCHNFMDLLSL